MDHDVNRLVRAPPGGGRPVAADRPKLPFMCNRRGRGLRTVRRLRVLFGLFMHLARLLLLIACGVSIPLPLRPQSPITGDFPRWEWQPTIAPPGAGYAGDGACAACHLAEAATQGETLMAKALRRPEDSEVLRQNRQLTFRKGRYLYEVRREGQSEVYSVSDGQRTIVVPVLEAVGYGLGAVGQTFLLEYQGYLFESEVTYYDAIHGLDTTPGHQSTTPAFLEGALGIRLPWRDQKACLACHATAAVTDTKLQLDQMSPGIHCEGCHGAGAAHIEAVKAGRTALHIFNPGSLRPAALNDFCGSCHRTALAEKLLGVRGVQNVRFQGYRLARSRCYSDDARMTCTACHNPHQPAIHTASAYDSKCLACHASTRPGNVKTVHFHTIPTALQQPSTPRAAGDSHASACPVAKANCTSCHMPKIEIPGVHFKFSDHWIRVAKEGSAYPE